MKIPFSYKMHTFNPVIWISLLGHITLLGSIGLVSNPQYGVQHGRSSMEVLLVEERPAKETPKVSEILTTQESLRKTVALRKRPEKKPVRARQKPLHIPASQGVLNAPSFDHLKNPAPVYPEFARQQGWEGLVVIKARVSRDGKADEVVIAQSSGYKILDEAALKAVSKWRFQPAGIAGKSFESSLRIRVRFSLTEEI